MKLNQLLKRITPLPWGKVPVMAQVLISRETMANQAYALHAANVLPELVAAARNMHENWERNLTDPMARLDKARELAETVNRSTEEVHDTNGTHHP